MNSNEPTLISCLICSKEIPLDAAFTPEGAQYVEHFCGLECYELFRTRSNEKVASKVISQVDINE